MAAQVKKRSKRLLLQRSKDFSISFSVAIKRNQKRRKRRSSPLVQVVSHKTLMLRWLQRWPPHSTQIKTLMPLTLAVLSKQRARLRLRSSCFWLHKTSRNRWRKTGLKKREPAKGRRNSKSAEIRCTMTLSLTPMQLVRFTPNSTRSKLSDSIWMIASTWTSMISNTMVSFSYQEI
mgnify:CR=1 FL=1